LPANKASAVQAAIATKRDILLPAGMGMFALRLAALPFGHEFPAYRDQTGIECDISAAPAGKLSPDPTLRLDARALPSQYVATSRADGSGVQHGDRWRAARVELGGG
jgi:hypothetical protein